MSSVVASERVARRDAIVMLVGFSLLFLLCSLFAFRDEQKRNVQESKEKKRVKKVNRD